MSPLSFNWISVLVKVSTIKIGHVSSGLNIWHIHWLIVPENLGKQYDASRWLLMNFMLVLHYNKQLHNALHASIFLCGINIRIHFFKNSMTIQFKCRQSISHTCDTSIVAGRRRLGYFIDKFRIILLTLSTVVIVQYMWHKHRSRTSSIGLLYWQIPDHLANAFYCSYRSN